MVAVSAWQMGIYDGPALVAFMFGWDSLGMLLLLACALFLILLSNWTNIGQHKKETTICQVWKEIELCLT